MASIRKELVIDTPAEYVWAPSATWAPSTHGLRSSSSLTPGSRETPGSSRSPMVNATVDVDNKPSMAIGDAQRHDQIALTIVSHQKDMIADGAEPTLLIEADGSCVAFPHSEP